MKRENTKQKIIETALTLFSERGYDAVSVGEIAKAADIPMLMTIGEEELFEKERQIFDYSLHNDNIRKFRKMMTIEQFRSLSLGELYTRRFSERLVDYHAEIFRSLIAAGVIYGGDTNALALMYVAPVITLIGVCDRQPERETECLEKLKSHVKQFYSMVHIPA